MGSPKGRDVTQAPGDRSLRKLVSGYLVIGLASALAAAAANIHAEKGFDLLKADYVARSTTEAERGAGDIDDAFLHIYQNLRTLASLPGIRTIDRHGDNLPPEARVTFQMIYNNLADSVAVSEVYVTPADFDPDRVDPVTGHGEEPIIMFDELILNAGSGMSADERASNPEAVTELDNNGPPEVETFEYRELKDQANWFRGHFPDDSQIGGLRVPLITGHEVITCDNTEFIASRADHDRKGIILSVPFFDAGGRFGGMVSAIMLSNNLRKLLPDGNFALVNTNIGYVNTSLAPKPHVQAAMANISRAKPDDNLLFSRVIPVSTVDPRNPWSIWIGYDDSRYFTSPEYRALKNLQFTGYGFAAVLLLAGCLIWYFISRDLVNSRRAAASLEAARDEARLAETEARALADKFQGLNADIGRLNRELTEKVTMLQDAQEEIVKRGRLAQLGQLTATIAHELRNPMGSIRNTAFLIRRKMKGTGLDLEQQLTRIDNGIGRCDDIITQLLDFARTKRPDFAEIDLDQWLAETVEEEAQSIPESVVIDCHLGLDGRKVSFDPGRLRRVLANLMSNAAEAMVGKPGMPTTVNISNSAICITTRLTDRGVEISVSDNGPGMDAETIAKVREPLFTTKNFGTGLGIPAVERILELHGGGLDIQSEAGQGASFTAWFPAGQADEMAA